MEGNIYKDRLPPIIGKSGKGDFEPDLPEKDIMDQSSEQGNELGDMTGGKDYGSMTDDNGSTKSKESTEDVEELPKHKRYIILALLVTVAFFGKAERTMIAPFYPIYAAEKNVTGLGIGMVIGSFDLTIWLSSLVWGFVIVKVGAKTTYAIGIIGTSIFSALFAPLALVEDTTLFLGLSIALRVLMGAFCGAYLVAETTILVSVFPKRIGSVLGIMETFGAIAVMLGPLIGGALYQVGGFHLPFIVLPACIIVIGIASLFIIPGSFHQERPKQSGCMMLTLPIFTVCMCFLLMFFAILSLHMSFLALQLNLYNLTPIQISLIFLTSPVLYMIFTPLAGLVVDKKPNWSYAQVIIGFTLTGFFLTLVGPAPFYGITPPPLWLLIFSFGMVGVFGSNIVAAISLMFRSVQEAGWPDSMDTYGLVAGFFQSSGAIGGATGSIIGGLVYQSVGWGWAVTGAGFIAWGLVVLMIIATCHRFSTASKQDDGENVPLAQEKKWE